MRMLNDVIGRLAPARQQKVEVRARELIAEELTLQDLRKAQKLTQEQMAKTLNIGQDSISRLEKRSDMMLSTMRSYVEAMGGSLELVARFPKRAPVIIKSIKDMSAAPKERMKRRKPELVRA
jgi:DNA-binding XRE family transcriptional regulator